MNVMLFIRLPDWLHVLPRRSQMQSQRPHHAGVVLLSVHDARRVSSSPAAGRRFYGLFERGGRRPAASKTLALSRRGKG